MPVTDREPPWNPDFTDHSKPEPDPDRQPEPDRQPVVAKLFIHHRKPYWHWKREHQGLQILAENDIAAPDILYKGKVVCENADSGLEEIPKGAPIHAILLNLLPEATNLRDYWHGPAAVADRVLWLKRALLALAQQHHRGILQEDLHLGNFLCADDGGDLVLRLSEPDEAAARKLDGASAWNSGGPGTNVYTRVPAKALPDDAALNGWLDKALEHSRTLEPKERLVVKEAKKPSWMDE